ncbi:MAG: fimbrillin family protein, partial [Bacteroidales bacterium]|nr:fimbrillin family protein [Bacteroidales bacterium]
MKRLFTALCVMCVALAATLSCSVSGPEGPEACKDVFEIRCGIEPFVMAEAAGAATAEAAPATTAAPAAAPATKVQTTVSGADLASTWEEGDAIGVFPSIGGDQVSFSLVSGAGSSNCIFNGDGWGLSGRAQYAAYFPYSADNYGDSDAYKSVKVSYIGQKQAAKGAYGVGQFDFMACPATTPSFDDPADPFGTCTFTFKHLGALLMLDVTFTSTSTLSKLELITNGSRFTEFGTVDLSAAAPAIASVSKGTTLSLDVAGISVTAGETARFYLMVAPDNLSGEMPTVKVTTSTGAVLSKQLPVTFNFEAGRAYSANVQMPAAPAPTVPSAGDGLTIYNTTGNFKYRYGPSIIMNDDGTIDAWFASPGSLVPGSGMADVFTWRRSSDG